MSISLRERTELTDKCANPGGKRFYRETTIQTAARSSLQLLAKPSPGEETLHRPGQPSRIIRGYQHPVETVTYHFRNSTCSGRDDRYAPVEGFKNYKAHGLGQRGMHEYIHARVAGPGVVLITGPKDLTFQALPLRLALKVATVS